MDIDSLRFGRKVRANAIFTTVAGSYLQICPPNPRRVALLICWDLINTLQLSWGRGDSAAQSFSLTTTYGLFELRLEHHGDLVTEGWFGKSAVGTSLVTVLESFVVDDSDYPVLGGSNYVSE